MANDGCTCSGCFLLLVIILFVAACSTGILGSILSIIAIIIAALFFLIFGLIKFIQWIF